MAAAAAPAVLSGGGGTGPRVPLVPCFDFAIDRGGTFTDVFACVPDPARPYRVLKLLSEDPRNYADAPREGIRRILEEVTGEAHPRDSPLQWQRIRSIRMGTTVATNALLERKGARMALLVTRGFRDLLHIGNQSRPAIFDLRIAKPDNLYETVVEVDERLILLREGEELPEHLTPAAGAGGGDSSAHPALAVPVVTGGTGERLLVEKAPDLLGVRRDLQALRDSGITAIAVALLHSYAYPEHERAIGAVATELGFTQVSLSSSVMPMVKIVPRGYTACADAYLTPHIVKYVRGFRSGFAGGLTAPPIAAAGAGGGGGVRLSFMQSDGGLTPVDSFSGNKAILSGPAGGVVGYALTTWDPERRQPIVAFDMGGTSTDVSRFDGRFEHVFETSIAGITIQAPQLDISTVAAGGGSRLFFRSGLFVVGPESAGAHPGPVCYRKGGHLAVTDANLLLGRIVTESFPHIFGPTEDQPLDGEASAAAFEALGAAINAFYAADGVASKSVDEIAYGYLQVANEAMCRPIRALTQMKGYDITTHVLACFGGAGPQHACAIARSLSMTRIFISRFSGILSAYGLSLADVVAEAQEPVAATLIVGAVAPPVVAGAGAGAAAADGGAGDDSFAAAWEQAAPAAVSDTVLTELSGRLRTLSEGVASKLLAQGFDAAAIAYEWFINLRYQGTDTAIMTLCATEDDGAADADDAAAEVVVDWHASAHSHPHTRIFSTAAADVAAVRAAVASAGRRFIAAYQREFGFVLRARDVVVDDVRVRGIAHGGRPDRPTLTPTAAPLPLPYLIKSVYFDGGRRETPVYRLETLLHGHSVAGPAMLIDKTSTVLVEPGFVAGITVHGDVELLAAEPVPAASAAAAAPVPAAAGDGGSLAVSASASEIRELLASVPAEPIQLSIFSHRFMGIAEQMGRVLQRTSISVNMRERLDYSCALFGPDGGLVANAPHIPVHLGAMQDAVRFQLLHWGRDLAEGDVLVSNHPQLAGGSHLPDITVITPVFDAGRIVFFVASRGHHADIGGIAPGSMPPMSKTLAEEGAAIVAFKLVQRGMFQEAGITDLLMAPGRQGIAGCSGSRNLRDCLSDLRAQVAANHKGITLVKELIAEYSLRTVHAYMYHIQANAEVAVRTMLADYSRSRGLAPVDTVSAVDHMDDGTPIALRITIDRDARTAVFDFTGTGYEVFGNTNAPRAVTYSAIIYSLRCLVGQDVPLNQGCLAPVSIIIPEGSLLHPSSGAAVVGGNVLTSQRVVDVVLRAFGACAASQGCMNNLTLGDDAFGYYETIAGGAGAGPGWHGRSGVHTHMTNCFPEDHEVLTELGFLNLAAVEAHFSKHPTLAVACWQDGRLEFHDISAAELTVDEGVHDHVLFESAGGTDSSGGKLAAADISLVPTGNHRMWLRMGRTTDATRHRPPPAGDSHIPPPFAIHTADAVIAAGAADASTDAQLLTNFELGFAGEMETAELPFTAVLGLRTNDEVDAFLELYGFWLGDKGRLETDGGCVMFGPCKPRDCEYLDGLFARLPLALREPGGSSMSTGYTCDVQDEDVPAGDSLAVLGREHKGPAAQRVYRILEAAWRAYFAGEYGSHGDTARKGSVTEAPGSGSSAAAAAAAGATLARECSCMKMPGDTMAVAAAEDASRLLGVNVQSPDWYWHWVWQRGLGMRRLRFILAGLRFAQGDEHLSSLDGGRIGTSSVRFRDETVRLALLAGYSAVFQRHDVAGDAHQANASDASARAKDDHWIVWYTETQSCVQPRLAVREGCRRITLAGRVWCVTVPTHRQLIMVRRVLETKGGVVIRASRPTIVGNTRITDPEIFERRYPIVLRRFMLRAGSGGAGKWRGGDGVVREIQVRRPLVVSILSERRAFQPYGLAGGSPGTRGINTLTRRDGRRVNLGGRCTVAVVAGETLTIESPGGGGYGEAARGDDEAAGASGPAAGGGDASAFLFTGSVGRYRETQETV